LTLLTIAGGALLVGRHAPGDLAHRPDRLRSAPTGQVIEAGLAEPEWPLAWQELERRAKAGELKSAEATRLLDGLTECMKRKHPQQPLGWMAGILRELGKPGLVQETQVLAFLYAFYGEPFLEPLPRLREGEGHLHLTCHWSSDWNEKPFDLVLLNQLRSITIDGEAIEPLQLYPKDWRSRRFDAELRLPALAPGKHALRCEIVSALIRESDLTGLAQDATAADWPPFRQAWTRIAQAELAVYAQDAVIVGLTNDPALYPLAADAPSTARIVVQRKGDGITATVLLKTSDTAPISFKVTLRIAGQAYECGSILSVPIKNGHASGANDTSVGLKPVDLQVSTGEVVLRPDPRAAEPFAGVDRIWGTEIVLTNVPITRHDLPETTPGLKRPAAGYFP
jgi:hypothetical protein